VSDLPGDAVGLDPDVMAALVRTHEWFAHNSGWAPPDEDTLADWSAHDVCRAPDDCLVAPGSWCPHGLASWLLVLRTVDDWPMTPRSSPLGRGRPTRLGSPAVTTARDASPVPDPADPDRCPPLAANEVPVVPAMPEALPDVHVAHLGAHDVSPPHELSAVDRFDQWADEAFDALRGTEPADRLFYALTELADFSLLWLLIATAKAALRDDEIPNAVRVAAVLAAESVVVNGGIKSVFKRERPVVQVARPYKLRVPLTTSFPSGHSSAAVVAAVLLAERSRHPKAWFALAVLVASSRVYVRIHHASDVVGGLALGVVLSAIARRAWPLDKGPIGTRWALARLTGPSASRR
jgi:undecaprenyl-diphosphatase